MPVTNADTQRVLAVCLITVGVILLCLLGALFVVVESLAGLSGPEARAADRVSELWFFGGGGLLALSLIWVGAWKWRRSGARARRSPRMDRCPKCHYSRTGLASAGVCPECGSAAPS